MHHRGRRRPATARARVEHLAGQLRKEDPDETWTHPVLLIGGHHGSGDRYPGRVQQRRQQH
jgi:hypothetical protein